MINTYLLPVCEYDDCYIISVCARNFKDAESKLIEKLMDSFDVEGQSLEELRTTLFEDYDIIVGKIYDKDEF